MLYFPLVFTEITLNGFSDTDDLTSAISEADLRQFIFFAAQTFLKEGSPPEFQIKVAIKHLETPSATIDFQVEVGVIFFRERSSVVITNLTSPLSGLLFPQRNSTILNMRQGLLNFLFFHASQTC